jgi:hypothetical protein
MPDNREYRRRGTGILPVIFMARMAMARLWWQSQSALPCVHY